MLRPMSPPNYRAHRVPPRAGVALQPAHAADIFENARGVAFFEVRAEAGADDGAGAAHALLAKIRELFPLALHGAGLSIGGTKPLDRQHLCRLQSLVALYRPGLFSAHLPRHAEALPYNETTLARVVAHVEQMQKVLGIQILLENPAASRAFAESTMLETEFLSEVVAHTGCGLLLDVNNVHASATRLGFDAFDYVDAFPVAAIGEIRLGRSDESDGDAVWALYDYAIGRAGPVPTLIEWADEAPSYRQLAAEAASADAAIERFCLATFKRSA